MFRRHRGSKRPPVCGAPVAAVTPKRMKWVRVSVTSCVHASDREEPPWRLTMVIAAVNTVVVAFPCCCRRRTPPGGWLGALQTEVCVDVFSVVVCVVCGFVWQENREKATTTTMRWWLPPCTTAGHHKGSCVCVCFYLSMSVCLFGILVLYVVNSVGIIKENS